MDKIDRKIEEIKAEQAELDRRTSVEKEALELIGQYKFKEAKELLDSLDDKEFRRKKKTEYSKNDYTKSKETESKESKSHQEVERYAVEARVFKNGVVTARVRPAKGFEGAGVLEGKLYCRCVDVFDSREEAEEFRLQYQEPWEGKEKNDYERD